MYANRNKVLCLILEDIKFGIPSSAPTSLINCRWLVYLINILPKIYWWIFFNPQKLFPLSFCLSGDSYSLALLRFWMHMLWDAPRPRWYATTQIADRDWKENTFMQLFFRKRMPAFLSLCTTTNFLDNQPPPPPDIKIASTQTTTPWSPCNTFSITR